MNSFVNLDMLGDFNNFDYLIDDEQQDIGVPTENIDELDAFSLQSSDTDNYDTEDDDSDNNDKDDEAFYYGQDHVTRWSKKEINSSSSLDTLSQSSDNVDTPKQARFTFKAMQSNSPIEYFCKFITKEMIEAMVQHTNQYISTIQEDPNTTPTSVTEIKGLIALLFLLRQNKSDPIENAWDKNDFINYLPFTIATMSSMRFLFLINSLRYGELPSSQTQDVSPKDKLAPIRTFLETFASNCKQNYTQGQQCLTIDKKGLPFRKIPLPNSMKYAKYLKMFALSDSKSLYIVNLEVHTRKQLEVLHQTSLSPENIVKRLCEPVKSSNCTLVLNRWFTSIPLFNFLIDNYNFSLIGGLDKDQKEIPRQFLANETRQVHSCVFGFQERLSLVSYVPKKAEAVLVLSTMHPTKKINYQTLTKKVPEMVSFYYGKNFALYELNDKCSSHSITKGTKNLPLCLFFELINIAVFNSRIVYKQTNPYASKFGKFNFMMKIGKELIKDHMSEMCVLKGFPDIINKVFPSAEVDFEDPSTDGEEKENLSDVEESEDMSTDEEEEEDSSSDEEMNEDSSSDEEMNEDSLTDAEEDEDL